MKKLSLEVITGPMFSGKSTELIRRCRTAKLSGKSVLLVKPSIDIRYSENEIVTHDLDKEKCIRLDNLIDIIDYIENNTIDIIAIDEIQFFTNGVIELLKQLSSKFRVIVSGLDMDFEQNPFGDIPTILAISDDIIKLKAICTCCGNNAMYSKRISQDKQKILIGTSAYQARCAKCFDKE